MSHPLDGLFFTGRDWLVTRPAARVRLYVAGDAAAPSPPHRETLRDLVERWADVRATIEAWLRALPPDGRVELRGRGGEGFRVASCGFDEPFQADSVAVVDAAAPERARVLFCTGLPDGYVTYELVLDAGVPVAIDAFCS